MTTTGVVFRTHRGTVKMPFYWAEFRKVQQDTFRFDTRIYLQDVQTPTQHDRCLGAVVGKNPGSACASSPHGKGLQPVALNGDHLLTTVRNIMLKAYRYIDKDAPIRSYLQVLNLFYLCNPDLSQAVKANDRHLLSLICDSEKKSFPWVWYVWGGKKDHLSRFKTRFQDLNTANNFFYDKNQKTMMNRFPCNQDFAKHIQGLRHGSVIPFLARQL